MLHKKRSIKTDIYQSAYIFCKVTRGSFSGLFKTSKMLMGIIKTSELCKKLAVYVFRLNLYLCRQGK